MKTICLVTAALAAVAIAGPAAAQAAPGEPPSTTRSTGLPNDFKVVNPKAKKQTQQKRQSVRARSAWLYDRAFGRPGAVTVTTPIHALDITYWYAWGPWTATQIQNSAGPTVSRSPATSGAQDVVIIYSLQVWNGSQWVQRTTAVGSSRIPAGYSAARLPHLTAFPNVGRGYFRVVEAITWFVAGTTTQLGFTAIVPHVTSDHRCTTPMRACAAYPGYLKLG
jgi:hypothetical protein